MHVHVHVQRINHKNGHLYCEMGKKEQVPARAIFVQGRLCGCGRRLAPRGRAVARPLPILWRLAH